MSTVKGTQKTIVDIGTAEHTVDPGRLQGNLRVHSDTYEAAALASASLIEIGDKLPLNSYIFETIMGNDALGSSTTLILGDAEDDNRYITSQDSSSAGVARTNVVDGMNYKIDETDTSNTDRQILVTLGGATGTGTIQVTIFWAHD